MAVSNIATVPMHMLGHRHNKKSWPRERALLDMAVQIDDLLAGRLKYGQFKHLDIFVYFFKLSLL